MRTINCVMFLGLALAGALQEASAQTAVPTFSGPVPVTAESWPWLAAGKTQAPLDLAAEGYVEEEFFVSGTANVYERTQGNALEVLHADVPYTTRILVRRPADLARFSGSVIVEPFNEARSFDWAFVWGLSHDYFTDRGDVFVGITHMPQSIDILKQFDAARYANLALPNPAPTEACGPQNATSTGEEGLHWDVYSQVSALLRSGTGPLSGFDVEKVYMTSHHGQAATYAAFFHAGAKVEGKPLYDGYLLPSSDAPMRLRRCGSAPGADDPARIVRNLDVPVIRVVPEGEVLGALSMRRDDSDAAGDLYRLYEVPGAPRMDRIYFQHLPAIADQQKAAQPLSLAKWPYNYICTPDIDLLDFPVKRYVVNAAFAHLERWAREGVPPPHADRIAIANAGTPEAALVRDANGNVEGGVRHTYVDVPTASYAGNSPGQCGNIANRQGFDWARMQQLYGSPTEYAEKVAASIETLVAGGWLLEADGERMRQELLGE